MVEMKQKQHKGHGSLTFIGTADNCLISNKILNLAGIEDVSCFQQLPF